MNEIINRVAISPIVTIDLEDYYIPGERVEFDLKEFLYQGIVLKEKDYREALKELEWEKYTGKQVAIFCSVDAILPTWAFMLAMTYLEGIAEEAVVGDLHALEQYLFQKSLASIRSIDFEDKPVVVKGCSKLPVPLFAYGEITKMLMGKARSIMYGEPCSTVPLYKRQKRV
jgi:hypothetical protein